MPVSASFPQGIWKRHADKFGAGGSVVTALCCLGFAPALSVLSAIGLGFLINDAILLPLLVVFLAIAIFGLWQGLRRHGRRAPLVAGTGVALVLLVFTFVFYVQLLAVAGLAGLVIATVLNMSFLRHSRPRTCET